MTNNTKSIAIVDLIEELDRDIAEFEDFLRKLLDDTGSMRSLIWAKMDSEKLSPEEQIKVAGLD